MTKILLYSDKGVFPDFLPIWKRRLTEIFGGQLDLSLINSQSLCAVTKLQADIFIMPGGEDLHYCRHLQGKGSDVLINYVANGGIYLGICGGAYFASTHIDFTGQAGQRIRGKRPLEFFPGTAVGSIPEYASNQYYHDDPLTASIVPIDWYMPGLAITGKAQHYYHGGCYFVPDEHAVSEWQACAMYPNQQIAAVCGHIGRGKFLLSGVHVEVDFPSYRDFLYSRYEISGDEKVLTQCRNMMGLDTGLFALLMYSLLDK